MIQLNCVACDNIQSAHNLAPELRDPRCPRCGQPLIQYRQPGSAPQVHPSA